MLAGAFGDSPAFVATLPRRSQTRYVSPLGSDRGPGTARHPWRTLAKAIRAARPGETIILRSGVFAARGSRTDWITSGTAGASITFEGDRQGPRPVILGYNKIEGSHLRLSYLAFQGPTGRVHPPSAENPGGQEVMVWVAGSDDELDRCQITGSRWHAGVYVAGGGHVDLVANSISHNGDFGNLAQANLDQGVYWSSGSGGLIADNLIADNLANGVQLYPAARDVTVEENTIVGNGKSGVIIANDAADNVIINNIVARNSGDSVRSFALIGSSNLVENNLVWDNSGGGLGTEAAGLTLRSNIRADPRFTAANDYRPQPGSPAVGRLLWIPASLPYDIDGASRWPRPDIGAFQSQ